MTRAGTTPAGTTPAGKIGLGRRSLLPAALVLLLPGCGFRPIYASHGGGTMGPAEAGLAAIDVGLIPERPGQELRLALQARLDHGAAVARRYDLAVTFGVSGEGIGIQADNSVSRVRLVGAARWTLRAQDPQRSTLASGTARSVDAYDVIDEQLFTADMQSEAVQKRIAEAVADQITLQLAAYFNKHAAS